MVQYDNQNVLNPFTPPLEMSIQHPRHKHWVRCDKFVLLLSTSRDVQAVDNPILDGSVMYLPRERITVNLSLDEVPSNDTLDLMRNEQILDVCFTAYGQDGKKDCSIQAKFEVGTVTYEQGTRIESHYLREHIVYEPYWHVLAAGYYDIMCPYIKYTNWSLITANQVINTTHYNGVI